MLPALTSYCYALSFMCYFYCQCLSRIISLYCSKVNTTLTYKVLYTKVFLFLPIYMRESLKHIYSLLFSLQFQIYILSYTIPFLCIWQSMLVEWTMSLIPLDTYPFSTYRAKNQITFTIDLSNLPSMLIIKFKLLYLQWHSLNK